MRWPAASSWGMATLPSLGGPGVFLTAFLDSSFRSASLSDGSDCDGTLAPAAAAHAVLRSDGGAGIARWMHMDLCFGAQGRSSLLPQETGAPVGTNSQVGRVISVPVRAAASHRAFSGSIQTVRDRARRVSRAVHSVSDGCICGARSIVFRGRLSGGALRSSRERSCVAPKTGITCDSAGVDFSGAGNSPAAA